MQITHPIPDAATRPSRQALIAIYMPIRLAEAQAKYPGRNASLVADYARVQAELDASRELSRKAA